MAKYVQPNFIVDSSASFLKNTSFKDLISFDSSIRFGGITYSSFGTMAIESSSNYYTTTEVENLIDSEVSAATVYGWNGLTKTDNSIGLGGTLTQDVIIEGGFDVKFGGKNTEISSFNVDSNGLGISLSEFGGGGINILEEGGGGISISEAGAGGIEIYELEGGPISVFSYNFGSAEFGTGNDNDETISSLYTDDTAVQLYHTESSELLGGETLFTVSNGEIIAQSDNSTFSGITYNQSYSDNFTQHSLVDKEYVDFQITQIDNSIAALQLKDFQIDASIDDLRSSLNLTSGWNGLTKTDNSIGLGGVLTTSTLIDASKNNFVIENAAYLELQGTSSNGVNSAELVFNDLGEGYAWFKHAHSSGTSESVTLGNGLQLDVASSPQDLANITFYPGSLTISSSVTTFPGIVYDEDWKENYSDRSLVDKGYVDGKIGSSDSSITDLILKNTQQDASIARIDASLNDVIDISVILDASFNELYIKNVQQDASIVRIDSVNISQDASIDELRLKDTQIDASITRIDASINSLLINTVSAFNGLTKTDNSIGLGGTLTSDTNINTATNTLFITGELNVVGNLIVDGSITSVNSVNLDVSDNIITINSGETGSGVSKGYAGLLVDRGTSDPYVFVFEESTDTFRIGIGTEGGLPVGTQAVATRQDSPTAAGIGFWNDSSSRIDTASGFTYSISDGLGLGTVVADGAETTGLFFDGTKVVSRELGSNAFTSTEYATAANLAITDASVSTLTSRLNTTDASLAGIISGGALKYTGTFDGTAGTTTTITAATHGLGVGPLSISVYDGVEQVYTDVECAANGDMTLTWGSGTLTASCKYVIIG